LPIEHVREVMRPCAVERVELAPAYVLGLALIRGQTVPVVDAGVLLFGERCDDATRLVILKVGERRVALAVAEVFGARTLERAELEGLPPLVADAGHLISHLAVLDGKLARVLESARLIEAGAEHVEAGVLS
jgi:purine-binding chemotaxis protein CheW